MLDFFWDGNNTFSSTDDIKLFFNIFSFSYIEYEVFFIADKILSTYDLPSQNEKLINTHTESEISKIIKDKNFLKIKSDKNFYSIKRKELDPSSAREKTEVALRLFSNLINIFHHKRNIQWENKFIIFAKDENNEIIVNKPIESMKKCIDLPEKKAKIQLQKFITSFYLEDDSFNKFINSVRLHSMAVHSSSVENQLLNLWVALESLIPEDNKNSNDSNIEHIINSVLPFLNIFYFRSLIEKLTKDLIRWDVRVTRKILKNVEGSDFIVKMANLVSDEKYSDKFNNLISKTKDFYLLNDRLNYFKNLFLSKKNIQNAINSHTKRLEWQIRRIYRARNLIVHTGITPLYTPILIEHTHSYLDIILSILIKLSSLQRITSVGQGFQYLSLLYNDYKKILKKEGSLSKDDINKIFRYIN